MRCRRRWKRSKNGGSNLASNSLYLEDLGPADRLVLQRLWRPAEQPFVPRGALQTGEVLV